MRKLALIILTLAVGAIAIGCGSSITTTTPTEQVRERMHQVMTAMVSNDPQSMCQYYTSKGQEKCLSAILLTKRFSIKMSSFVTPGWEDRLSKATITINGNRAVVSNVINADSDKATILTYVGGQWLVNPN